MPAALEIDGHPVPTELVVARGMNFSRPIPGETPLGFLLRVAVPDFCAALAVDYRRVVGELQEDLAIVGLDEGTSDVDLMRAGWPPLELLIRTNAPLAETVMDDFLRFEILAIWARADSGTADYVINFFDGVTIDGDDVVVAGRCYRIDKTGAPGR